MAELDKRTSIFYALRSGNHLFIGTTNSKCQTMRHAFNNHIKLNSDYISACENKTAKFDPLYDLMSEVGSDQFKIEGIENFTWSSTKELNKRKKELIESMKADLNKVPKGKEGKQEWNRNYYLKNKETINEKRKDNIEAKRDSGRKWYYANAEKIKQRKNELIECSCGKMIRRGYKSDHIKTKFHKEILLKLEQDLLSKQLQHLDIRDHVESGNLFPRT